MSSVPYNPLLPPYNQPDSNPPGGPPNPHPYPVPDTVKSGRRRTGTVVAVVVGTTPTVFAPGDDKRVAIRVSSHFTNRLTISDNPNVIIDAGINIPVNGAPVELSIETYGNIVNKKLFAISTGAATQVGFVESRLED